MPIHPRFGLVVFALLASSYAGGADETRKPAANPPLELETIDQPPAKFAARENLTARSPGMRVVTGPYVSIQVNVDAAGHNIIGDAANEPSIAVNPVNPANMVIGWRQFDSVTSNFRQAGWGYTFNKGQSWTFPGVLTPGTFRSDPSLDVNSSGVFYYQSLQSDVQTSFIVNDVFKSTDGGVTWGEPVSAFGGDKNWLVVDRTEGPTNGTLYGIWQRFFSCCDLNVLTRSTDGGQTFASPIFVEAWPTFGTLAVGPDGTLFAVGIDGTVSQDTFHFVIAWPKFEDGPALAPPDPPGRPINLGGYMDFGDDPNPVGLLGQVNVSTDSSHEASRGNVYVLASVIPLGSFDPLDVHVIRSVDSARNFSAPVRVNDDPGNNWQWLAAHAVAPNGRIDAIWFDTRDSQTFNLSRLYYAYSWNGGDTWSPNVPVSPMFNSLVGWPRQNKMGDYSTLVSDASGADAAYAATFNGEQDVYYVRLFPDCNGNGISDVTDITAHASQDCNASHIPDECETAPTCIGSGSVPDGGSVPGAPLTIAKGASDTIVLSWGASCVTTDADYAVYEGSLGDFASHESRACSTGGSRSIQLNPIAVGAYYLVVPVNADREGSYGSDSSGVERPAGINACAPRVLHACGG